MNVANQLRRSYFKHLLDLLNDFHCAFVECVIHILVVDFNAFGKSLYKMSALYNHLVFPCRVENIGNLNFSVFGCLFTNKNLVFLRYHFDYRLVELVARHFKRIGLDDAVK